MKKTVKALLAASTFAAIAIATPALAQDEPAPDFTITGSASVTTQYRLRGISQTDNRAAVQGGITVSHKSGVYVGTWASNLGGNGTWGGSNMELDLIAGFTKPVGGVTLDGGVVYYLYPGTTGHDYVEVYASGSGKIGPVNAKLGMYWAPKQNKIGGHNVWIYTDMGLPISGTPITLKGHLGYSTGNSIYTNGGIAGTPLGAKSKDVLDYGVGADITWKNLTLNVSYIGTDMNAAFANANFGAGARSGHDITKGNVVATLTATF